MTMIEQPQNPAPITMKSVELISKRQSRKPTDLRHYSHLHLPFCSHALSGTFDFPGEADIHFAAPEI